jgi:hypothetical protein
MSAPTATSGACNLSGTVSLTVDSVVSAGTTTNTLDITFTNCREYDAFTGTYSELNGSMTGTHAFNDTIPVIYESANLDVTLTDTEYPNDQFTAGSETNVYSLNGVFSSVNNNNTSGINSALGSFSWTEKDPVSGDITMSFSIGSGQTPVTDVWSITTNVSGTTETNTGNGVYSMSISAPGVSLTYNLTLADFEYKLLTYTNGDTDEWINGSVTISWNPDLSQWGCLNGTYTFTTAAGTPIHTPWISYCPTSGTVQVNNATIQFNPDQTVTVSIGGLSETFEDCESLGNGMCS